MYDKLEKRDELSSAIWMRFFSIRADCDITRLLLLQLMFCVCVIFEFDLLFVRVVVVWFSFSVNSVQ